MNKLYKNGVEVLVQAWVWSTFLITCNFFISLNARHRQCEKEKHGKQSKTDEKGYRLMALLLLKILQQLRCTRVKGQQYADRDFIHTNKPSAAAL